MNRIDSIIALVLWSFKICLVLFYLYYMNESLNIILFGYINRILKCSLNGNLQLTLDMFFVFKQLK